MTTTINSEAQALLDDQLATATEDQLVTVLEQIFRRNPEAAARRTAASFTSAREIARVLSDDPGSQTAYRRLGIVVTLLLLIEGDNRGKQ